MQFHSASLELPVCANKTLEHCSADYSKAGGHVPFIATVGGSTSVVNDWAVVGGWQLIKSDARIEERKIHQHSALCLSWEDGTTLSYEIS